MLHDNCILCTLHDAGIGTLWLYTKWTICILRLVHDDHRPNAQFACYRYDYTVLVLFAQIACYGIGTIIFLIVTVSMEYHIIVLITCNFVFQRSIVSVWISFLLVSAVLFAVWVSIRVYRSLEVVGVTICHPFAISAASFELALGLLLESLPGTRIRLGPTYL